MSRSSKLDAGVGEAAADLPVIDVHTHILPERWPDMAARTGYPGWVRLEHEGPGCGRLVIGEKSFRSIDDRAWSPARRLADCDAQRVRVQVLSTVPVLFSYWAKAAHALELGRVLNDHVAETCRARPDRFVGLGTVPLQDPDLACRELDRCVGELGLRGIEIGTHVGPWNLDAPELEPVFERAEALGAVIFVHPWDMLGADRMQRYFLPWLVGMPCETALAMCSVIFSGLLDRRPRLRLLFAHGGGAIPGTIARIDQGFHARPDLCAVHIHEPPSRYARRLHVDGLVHDGTMLRRTLDVFGADRVCTGSDYPFPLGEEVSGALARACPLVDGAERAAILAGNAARLFGIDGIDGIDLEAAPCR